MPRSDCRDAIDSRRSVTRLRRRVTSGVLILFLVAYWNPIDLDDIADYLRTPASTSPRSRWYSLDEIGLTPKTVAMQSHQKSGNEDQANNTRLLDLSDWPCLPQLMSIRDEQVLATDEPWEFGIETGQDTVGYPSVVHNVAGKNPDGKYYLFYSIHDPYAGIAVAVADNIGGPYRKLRHVDPIRRDSRILRAPKRPRKTSHFSSPVVVWNANEKLWFLYFHFYSNEWESGGGHQRTAIATTDELAAHRWKVWTDEDDKIIAVLPTTQERWMYSQSSYHVIQQLPNGYWLAFLRGTGGEYDREGRWKQDPSQLGFAVSRDGRHWAELPGNPLIHQQDGRNGKNGVYRPLFIGLSSTGWLLAWSEASFYDHSPSFVVGVSPDFRQITPIQGGLAGLPLADGPLSIWRSGDRLYVFYRNRLRQMTLKHCF